jgi:hypothetical protein
MASELQATKIQKPLRESLNIFKFLVLALSLGLATSCNSTINESIRGCEEGVESACTNISANEWAKKQVVTSKGKEALALALNKVKYKQDIDNAEKCLRGQNAWCSDVNIEHLRIVDKESADNVLSKKDEINKANLEAERIAAEKATYGNWIYSRSEDMATGKTSSTASIQSENSLSFGFPYQGSQFAQLTLRRHPRYGFDAYISISQGQILCNEYSNPYILVRFNNGNTRKYECAEPEDNSSTLAFIRNAGEFERALKSASIAYITLTFYQEGSQTLKFKVKGYDPTKI